MLHYSLQELLDISPGALMVCNTSGIITFCNDVFRTLFNFSHGDAIGVSINDILCSNDSFEEDNPIITDLKKIIDKGMEVTGRRSNGSLFPVYLTAREFLVNHQSSFICHFVDISYQKEIEKRLTSLQERTTLAQRFASFGFWEWDIATGDLIWSPEIAPMFGYEKGFTETTYDNFLTAIHPDDRDKVVNAVNNAIDHGMDYHIEHRVIWPDHSIRWLLEKGDVIRDESGAPIRMLGAVQDITDRFMIEKELIDTKNSADDAVRGRTMFLANMSHEIRTPMNSIIGLTEILLENRPTDEQETHLTIIEKSAKSLLSILNSILDLSKLEAGAIAPETMVIDIKTLVSEAVRTIAIQAEKKHLSVEYIIKPGIPQCVSGDGNRIRQVILNLLSNAVKFTTQGSIILSVNPGRDNEISFVIEDTGIGMTEETLKMIFNPFTQAENSTTRKFGGTGLGTTISKQLVELMGGTISVASTYGKGTTFSVTLPLSPTDCSKREHPDSHNNKEKPIVDEFTVLVAEDNDANLTLVELKLKAMGCRVIKAVNGREAVDQFAEHSVDLVLMDIQMPLMDGLSATKEIRYTEKGKDVPIMAVTANVMNRDRDRYDEAEFTDVIPKPIDFNDINEIITDLRNQKKAGNSETPLSNEMKEKCSNIFLDIRHQLGTFNPDNVKPLLDRLNTLIAAPLLEDIKNDLENYDFDGAEEALRELAGKLAIPMEDIDE